MKYAHPQPVVALDATILGEQLFVITAGHEGLIRVWQLNAATAATTKRLECIMLLEGHTRGVTAVAISGNDLLPPPVIQYVHFIFTIWAITIGSNLWSGSLDFTIRCWDLNTGTCLRVLAKGQGAHQGAVTCMSTFHSEGTDYIMSGGVDMRVVIVNCTTGEVVWSAVHSGIVTAVKTVRDIESKSMFRFKLNKISCITNPQL
jgi:WD40 repeat protein